MKFSSDILLCVGGAGDCMATFSDYNMALIVGIDVSSRHDN